MNALNHNRDFRRMIRRERQAYQIWGVGMRFNWHTDPREIANILKMKHQTVTKICNARGWTKRFK